jgi:hypothetical protein
MTDRASDPSSSSKVVRSPAYGAIILKAGFLFQNYLLILKNVSVAAAA